MHSGCWTRNVVFLSHITSIWRHFRSTMLSATQYLALPLYSRLSKYIIIIFGGISYLNFFLPHSFARHFHALGSQTPTLSRSVFRSSVLHSRLARSTHRTSALLRAGELLSSTCHTAATNWATHSRTTSLAPSGRQCAHINFATIRYDSVHHASSERACRFWILPNVK